jgi:hypothetical protein
MLTIYLLGALWQGSTGECGFIGSTATAHGAFGCVCVIINASANAALGRSAVHERSRAAIARCWRVPHGRSRWRWEVSGQFACRSASDDVSSAYWVNVSDCFELLLFAVDDIKQLSDRAWPKNMIFQPGSDCLKSPSRPIGSYSFSWTEELDWFVSNDDVRDP